MSDEQTQPNQDDPSGPGWRDVLPDEILHPDDMVQRDNGWGRTRFAGIPAGAHRYRRRIEPQPSDSEQRSESTLWGKLHAAMKPDPEFAWTVHCNYAMQIMDEDVAHGTANRAAARIMLYFHHIDITQNHHWATMFEGATPPQPSDSEPETMEQLRRRLDEYAVLLDEAERGGQQVNAELQQLREQVQALTTERDEHARKAATAHNLLEMSRRQVQDEAGKVEQLKQQLHESQRTAKRYRNQLEGAWEHAPKGPRNFRERMVLEKFRAFVEAQDDDPLTFGYVQLRATDPKILGCSEFVVESWHQDVGGGRLSESVRVFLRHYASEEDQESRKESSARTHFHVKTVGDYERLLSFLEIGGQTE